MHKLNDPNFHCDGRPRRFGKFNSKYSSPPMTALDFVEVEHFEPVSTPLEHWKPVKLINDRKGVAYTIKQKLGWTDIVRHLLQDNTNPSNLAKLIRGECKQTNGWRCEYL
jgi:hypothetical protein